MNMWKNVWQNREFDIERFQDSNSLLSELIKLDGFDSGFSGYSVESWKLMVADLKNRIYVSDGSCLLEIGCGGGALLYELNRICSANLFGIDYSDSLIDIIQSLGVNSPPLGA